MRVVRQKQQQVNDEGHEDEPARACPPNVLRIKYVCNGLEAKELEGRELQERGRVLVDVLKLLMGWLSSTGVFFFA